MLVQIAGELLCSAEPIADAAEVDIEILRPRRPLRAKQAEEVQFVLDAAADRKPGLAMGERCAAQGRLRDALLDLPKSGAAGGIEQGRPDRVAQPAAHGAEPGELLIDRGCARDAGQISAPGAALEIGVKAQNPASQLPIVA